MSTDRHRKVIELFEATLEQSAERRPAFLAEACAGDAGLVGEVESLLVAHAAAEDFLEAPVAQGAGPGSFDGRRVGPYELIRELGRGGMGSVYVARRADDAYRRRVAVKLIRPGMATDFVLERFRHERQILASLEHPNIARLIDGGTTPDGLPYLVMEYVEGQAIDRVCAGGNLSVTERLELFRTVCSAVSYAHRNLVVHRDIKPANILVTAGGAPKLLDFGIAKLLNPDLAGGPGAPTATALRMMTPEYASPEQARGDAITTASDVYSLGVVLYELLTGQRPYQVAGLSPSEVERAICESEPPRPSTAVRTTRPARATSSADRLRRRLAGDLDNIVLMALRKEPLRRYTSVDQLSEDIGRCLEHQPVLARRGTWSYHAAKFVRRNRVGVAAAALIGVSLAAGVVATSWQARAAGRERARAVRLLADVRSLTNAFVFEFHDAIAKLPGSTPVRELVVRRALAYLDRLASDASDDPTLQLELASGYARLGSIQWARYYANLGDLTGALESQRKALDIRERVVASHPGDADARRALGFSLVSVADALAGRGELREALARYRRSVEVRESLVEAHPDRRADERELAVSYQRVGDLLGNPGQENLGDPAGALEYFRRMQEIFERLARDPGATADDRHSVGIGYEKLGRVTAAAGDREGALAYYRRELDAFQADAASDSTSLPFRRDLAVGYGNVGDALADLGRPAEALRFYEPGHRIRAGLLAADPKDMGALRDLAFMDRAIGSAIAAERRERDAVPWLVRATDGLGRVYAVDPMNRWIRSQLVGTHHRVATVAAAAGQASVAGDHGSRALAVLRSAAGHPSATGADHNAYAWALLTTPVIRLRDPAAAIGHAERAVTLAGGKDAAFFDTLARAYHQSGQARRAIDAAERGLALLPAGAPGRAGIEATLTRIRAEAPPPPIG